MYEIRAAYPNELYHYGIEGQKWGKRNGPPYPLDYSDHSAAEKKHLTKEEKIKAKSYKAVEKADKSRQKTASNYQKIAENKARKLDKVSSKLYGNEDNERLQKKKDKAEIAYLQAKKRAEHVQSIIDAVKEKEIDKIEVGENVKKLLNRDRGSMNNVGLNVAGSLMGGAIGGALIGGINAALNQKIAEKKYGEDWGIFMEKGTGLTKEEFEELKKKVK